jgi:hypothetical protein
VTWLRRICLVVAVVAGAGVTTAVPATPGSAAPPPYPPSGPTVQDGMCGDAPGTPAGEFDPDLAVNLITGN